jgi:hypothetical protein
MYKMVLENRKGIAITLLGCSRPFADAELLDSAVGGADHS